MFNQFKPNRWASDSAEAWWRSDEIPALRSEDFTDNARAVDVLLRYTSNGDHPQWIAEAIKSGDTHAVAKLADLAQQLDVRQPGRGQSYVDDVMRRLPIQELQDVSNLPSLPPDPRSSAVWDDPDPEVEHYTDSPLTFSAANDTSSEKKYIWRTAGDSKVRSAHADRNGKTFSWDDPPEGGHPGEAPNCRCRAEDVNLNSCKHLRIQLEVDSNNLNAARKRYSSANKHVDEISAQLDKVREGMSVLVEKTRKTKRKLAAELIIGRPNPVTLAILASFLAKYTALEFDHADLADQHKKAKKESDLIYKYEVKEAQTIRDKTLAKLEEQDCNN